MTDINEIIKELEGIMNQQYNSPTINILAILKNQKTMAKALHFLMSTVKIEL